MDQNLHIELSISDLRLDPVFILKRGPSLIKGGQKANAAIHASCSKVKDRFLCYYWRHGDDILYVGSVSKDYKGKRNNLWGRVGNYLQNHREGATNKNVFDEANLLLISHDIEFGVFRFDRCASAKKRLPIHNVPRIRVYRF